jgi:CubicO group peptidase (beta-lactamase class C family)
MSSWWSMAFQLQVVPNHEAVSDQSLEIYFRENIFAPLGMKDSGFLIGSGQKRRVATFHSRRADGGLEPAPFEMPQRPEFFMGGGGAFSTPRDYMTFQRALLGGGELDGVRILQEATVDAAFTNQIGDLDFPAEIPTADPASTCDFNAGPGWKFGYGLLLNTEDVPEHRRAGSGAWAGLLNTHFWIDRTTGIAGAIYTQFLPFVTPEAFQMYFDFEGALYESL